MKVHHAVKRSKRSILIFKGELNNMFYHIKKDKEAGSQQAIEFYDSI